MDNFGIEVGATKYKALKIKEDARFKVKPNNFYMDLVGYMPIESNMELIGSIGLGKLKADLYQKGKNISKNIKGFKSSKVGPRVGFGGQYNFNENLSTRVMVRYQKIGNKSIFKSATTASIGIVYTI